MPASRSLIRQNSYRRYKLIAKSPWALKSKLFCKKYKVSKDVSNAFLRSCVSVDETNDFKLTSSLAKAALTTLYPILS